MLGTRRGDELFCQSIVSAAEKAAIAVAHAAGAAANAVTDEMFAQLRQYWSEKQIVEIVAAIAATGFVNRWNAAMVTGRASGE